MARIFRFLLLSLALTLSSTWARAADSASFKPEELEQLVAPIALYPDALVAQIFMASTYPLEVVSAARWSKANPNVKDKQLENEMQKQDWDASVKSLAAFPQVLQMMNDKLDWTQKLGDAFLAQQADVMSAVQRLRSKANEQGNLKSSKEQTVTVDSSASTQIIKIEPAQPDVVYVPVYNPTYVYGPWPYPYYSPFYWYPPYYSPGAAIFSFGVGLWVGAALWGNCNWGRGDVNINVNRFNNFNRTDISNGNWNHNVDHRRGVQYRDSATQERFNKGQRPGAENREAYRGRADEARQQLQGQDRQQQVRDQVKQADRKNDGQQLDRQNTGDRAKQADRAAAGTRDTANRNNAGTRDMQQRAPRDNAFRDIDHGNSARAASTRGNSSFKPSFSRGGGRGR